MNIYLTDEQYKEMLEEGRERDGEIAGTLYIRYKPADFELYCENITKNGNTVITYVEANTGGETIGITEEEYKRHLEYMEKHKMSEKNNECPNCFTPMIYRFNYCPKCGQILEWEEENAANRH